MKLQCLSLILLPCLLFGHEGGKRNAKPTAASKDLALANTQFAAAKKQATAKGRYACCVKPACDLCLRKHGSCACAANVKAGKGACGECMAGWQAGRGALPGVKAATLPLLPSEKQRFPGVAPGELSPELRVAMESLLRAKKTLVKEKRFLCCIGGGCGQCAFEADCPCGSDLATKGGKGVCGDCVDGWHAGQGSFAGVSLAEIKLSRMDESMAAMSPGTRESGSYFASGTAQLPAAQPFGMLTKRWGEWNLMFAGNLFGVYTNQGSPRGRDKIFGTGWVMPMASRRLGRGLLSVRTMFSPEPLLVTNGRYPLLWQEGETWKNVPVLNGQHPHDFVKELAVGYQYKLGEQTALNFYYGLRGDPAIGPVAYVHRTSQSENPLAVLSHHYQDSTHISGNVATAGATHRWVTLEASAFHGREPDEKRWGIEMGKMDSFASRVTVTPTARWAGQFSLARINNREATHPDRDSWRQSASLTYVRPMATGHWAWSGVWGRNHDLAFTQQPNLNLFSSALPPTKPGSQKQHVVLVPTRINGQIYNSYTLESTLFFKRRQWVWGRAELTDKNSLLLFEEAPFVRLIEEQRYTRVKAYTMGYSYDLKSPVRFLQPALGGQFMLFQTPENLRAIYGSYPKGMQVWLRVRIAPRIN